MNIPEIKFGKIQYIEDEGGATVYSVLDVKKSGYLDYISALLLSGYSKSEEYSLGPCSVTVLKKDSDLILCTYYEATAEARIVTEQCSKYFGFSDTTGKKRCGALMTQIDLEDFGGSVIFRLCDGRFIIFDGGWDFEPDAEKLIKCLREQSPDPVPIVACWIFTHPHIDHYRCFVVAYEKFAEAFKVERFLYNFPSTDESDLTRAPGLVREAEYMMRLDECVKKTGAPVYKAHTGQVYEIGGARLEVLSSPDDAFFVPVNNLNSLSLIIKLTLEGQVFMMCADALLKVARLADRFGAYLKSDILQPTHHMFDGGDIKAYDFIDPRVCVAESFESHVFGTFSPVHKLCREANLHLFYNLHVEEFFTGGVGNIILPIPYEPSPNGKMKYLKKLEEHERRIGAKSWFFSDLDSEGCEFVITNVTFETAKISVDLYSETDSVESIRFDVPEMRVKRVNVLDTNAVDGDALFYNPKSLAKKGVPSGTKFTVHIRSNLPIVVKGSNPADYFA